jgi:hypothetical protein
MCACALAGAKKNQQGFEGPRQFITGGGGQKNQARF